jgi:hypothetical protein
MPIAPPGSQEPQLDGDIGEAGAQIWVMAGVPGFHGIQSLGLEALDQSAGATFFQMSGRHHTTGGVDHFGDGSKAGKHLFHECRAAAPNQTIEGIGRVGRPAVAHDRSCDMRPAHRTPA